MNRSQHIVGSGLVFAVGIWVAWVSFTQEPAEAFLFPRLIASVFVVLAGWTFGKAVMGLSKVGSGISRTMFLNMVPGLALMLVYVFWAAKALGFYTATAIGFFILLSLYDPAPHSEGKTWVKRALITGVFVAVMYGLFAKLLSVYTPREILF
ncbi:tripartite tricarboxylate transporter TctB family protein [Leisingera sp. SS27]|uniref:tripartite tricarboxylate transporter TctB family protein n=1 Tax=Leisingera sp. SS27 TaxID=2979462 RepID=UPI00232CCF26|nr:tripartite tricarboxylate transporter TctB family protein [Leisingera sp. SS27]MDC0658069.1 tripartite tricarboxylate transporter TctB family protein [Leisingera sp. SS27]